ncbi:MAG: CooT family nickel-binding protein [Zestosphaera sp.]
MCEYKVLLNGELVLDEVIYARVEGGRVILRNVLGESRVLDNCVIVEVNVKETKLVLSRTGVLG